MKFLKKFASLLNPEIKNKTGWGKILQLFVKGDKSIKNISSQRFIKDHEHFEKHLNKPTGEEEIDYYEKLVIHLSSKDLIKELMNQPISCSYSYAYYIIITEENIESKLLEEKLCNELDDGLETGDWYRALCNESKELSILDVAIELVKKRYTLKLKHKFVDALINHSQAIIKGDAKKVGDMEESWDFLLNALTTSERKHFREKLLHTIDEEDKDISPLLGVYAKEISIAIEEATKKTICSFIHNTCVRIAEDKNRGELSWMLNLFSSNESLIGQAKQEDKDVLRNRLKGFLKDEYIKEKSDDKSKEEPIQKDIIENIAKQIDISLVEEKSENPNEGKTTT